MGVCFSRVPSLKLLQMDTKGKTAILRAPTFKTRALMQKFGAPQHGENEFPFAFPLKLQHNGVPTPKTKPAHILA